MCWLSDPTKYFEERTFAGAVAADDAHHLAGLHLEIYVLECPEVFAGETLSVRCREVRCGTEWAAKMPMLLGSLATLALTVWMARRLFARLPEMEGDNTARDAAWLAGSAWLVNPANLTMIYHCRPDPVLVMFMTGAWILGTIIGIKDKSVSLRSADTKLEVLKSSIAEVTERGAAES